MNWSIAACSSDGVQHGRGRIGAHAAGIGTGVAVADALVILRARKRDDILAVAEGEEACFLAVHEFLDHDGMTALPEAAFEHEVDGLVRLGLACGDDHALAGGQAVGLDHHRIAQGFGKGPGGIGRGEAPVGGGGNAGLARKDP